MLEKIQGIVIGVLRHSDRHDVVTLYTRSHGRMAFLYPVSGNSKRSKARNARLLPLSIIETEVNINPSKDLNMLRTVNSPMVWKSIYFNPVKSSMILFLSEFLNKLLRETAPDTELWNFIVHSINILDTQTDNPANFHITFLIRLTHFAGISPDISNYNEGCFFDMRGGIFSDFKPPHPDYITPQQSKALYILLRINYRNMHLYRLTGETRKFILNTIIQYYSIHFPGTSNLKSLNILHEIFS